MGKNNMNETKISMSRAQKEEYKKNLELPINRFLNAKNEDGSAKYPIAQKIRDRILNNTDAIENDLRMANALAHQVRWRMNNSIKYFEAYTSSEPVTLRDDRGMIMSREDCYLAYLSDKHNVQLALSKLRDHICGALLSKCDGEVFTFDQYSQFVTGIEENLAKVGCELFPNTIGTNFS